MKSCYTNIKLSFLMYLVSKKHACWYNSIKLGSQPGFGEDTNQQSTGKRTNVQKNASVTKCWAVFWVFMNLYQGGGQEGRGSQIYLCLPLILPNWNVLGLRKFLSRGTFIYLAPFLSPAVKKEQPTLPNFSIILKLLPSAFLIWRDGDGRAWLMS